MLSLTYKSVIQNLISKLITYFALISLTSHRLAFIKELAYIHQSNCPTLAYQTVE